MVRVLVLPDNEFIDIGGERVKVREIIDYLGEQDPDYIVILINDSLVRDPDIEVTSLDRVVVIKQPTGG